MNLIHDYVVTKEDVEKGTVENKANADGNVKGDPAKTVKAESEIVKVPTAKPEALAKPETPKPTDKSVKTGDASDPMTCLYLLLLAALGLGATINKKRKQLI